MHVWVMPKLQRAALVITLALLSPSPSFAQSGKAESIPANGRALTIFDASSLQDMLSLFRVPRAGDRFVLKDVRVIMQDTRYIEGWLSRKKVSTGFLPLPAPVQHHIRIARKPKLEADRSLETSVRVSQN